MCKFTTIILLLSTFSILTPRVSAQNADIESLISISNNSSAGLRQYSAIISNTTTFVTVSTPLVMGAIAIIHKDDDLLKSALYVGVAIGVDGVLTYGLKYAVDRPRPFAKYPEQIVGYGSETSGSFPSGHTSVAFTTATALSLKYPKWYVMVPAFAWAGSVGYSRMNLGMHYPSDVVAGALLGAGSAYATYFVNEWFWKKQQNRRLIGLQAYL